MKSSAECLLSKSRQSYRVGRIIKEALIESGEVFGKQEGVWGFVIGFRPLDQVSAVESAKKYRGNHLHSLPPRLIVTDYRRISMKSIRITEPAGAVQWESNASWVKKWGAIGGNWQKVGTEAMIKFNNLKDGVSRKFNYMKIVIIIP